jgi:hypothetical protein
MRSFSLLRTNVGLTTNIKITIDSNYNLSLDSIESNERLSDTKLKRVKFNKNNFWDELVPYFFKNIPSETAFDIKYDNDIDTMSTDFSVQYDEIYQYGSRNISNNKEYSEEFEYFAPLYIKYNNLPKNFIIFRIDGPGLGVVNRKNFKSEILNKLKTVKIFDLSNKTNIGEWFDLNFTNNVNFPNTPLEIDFRNLEFSKWNGIDFKTGGYTSKSLFLNDFFSEEKEIYEFEKFIFDNYKNSNIVFPNILNLSFLFDDEPSTPEDKRKWSINRYCGFYLDNLEKVTTISPYITPFLRDDIEILEGNILNSPTNSDPFVEGWSTKFPIYIEYKGEYYPVEEIEEQGNIELVRVQNGEVINETPMRVINKKYKIISDLDLTGKQSEINQNFGYIKDGTIFDYQNNPFIIDNFDSADVWLIEIDGIYHNIIKDEDDKINIVSDYSFIFSQNDFVYKVGGVETKILTIVDFNNPPKVFNIYRCNFTDVKDFDTKLIDTNYSRFEYEKLGELTTTEESKMYMLELNDSEIPKRFDDYIINGEVVNIPVSSEYTANHETFKIESGDLSPIWRKNSNYCRWVYQNSLSANDYPYLLNNSLIFEDYNRTVNPFDSEINRPERNLDYFYSINSSTVSYQYHSLHVQKVDNFGNLDTNFRFDISKYLNISTYSIGTSSATYSFDYFSQLFEQNQLFESGNLKLNTKKYSIFNKGDNSIPNQTLFRGIKFSIYDVDSLILSDSSTIENINLKNSNSFEDFKFSILLSDNSPNDMNWYIIENWQMDKIYTTGSIVIFDDILYQSQTETITELPIILNNNNKVKTAPYNSSDWIPYSNLNNIFWEPNNSYVTYSLVYNNNEYYNLINMLGSDDFWNPTRVSIGATGYGLGETVLFKGQYYTSLTSSNIYPPDYNRPEVTRVNNLVSDQSASYQNYWELTQTNSPIWEQVPLWSENSMYMIDQLVVYNDIVWGVTNSNTTSDDVPGISNKWIRKWSLIPDSDYIYQPTDNPIIEMNNEFYMILQNVNNSTLENGIIIYINKKWKNVLINISISDNTLPNISESDRDSLYKTIYKKLSAFNFIQSINDISNKYQFIDYLKYVIIEEDGTISEYDLENNISNIPVIIICETPDEFGVKIDSLKKTPIVKPEKLKSYKNLNGGRILNNLELNYYNNSSIGYSIENNEEEPKVFENYHGNKNFKEDIIYRFSGTYMPLFYDIELFKKDMERQEFGNYKFDDTLINFGIIKERKIRKINRKSSILKLADVSDFKSIYPMLDEFGLTYDDEFIFKSTWDFNYHIESYKPNSEKVIIEEPIITTNESDSYGQPQIIQSQNNNQLL